MPASPPDETPPQLDTSQFHSEFGYLVPTIRFHRKVALTLKGAACGLLVGAVVTFFAMLDRGEQEKAFSMVSTPATMADAENSEPVPFVAASVALPAAVPGHRREQELAEPSMVAEASAPVPAVATAAAPPADTVADAPEEVKEIARPRRKVVRERRRERAVHATRAEPEPRAAYAGPFRPFSSPYRSRRDRYERHDRYGRYERFDRPIFGFGW